MTIGLFIVFALICFVADLAARTVLNRVREQRRRREREKALAVNLKLDFSREARTLKRVEVNDPVARILCVDDEDIVLDSFRKILVLDGYSVDTVQTGPEALGLIQTHHYEFVFTDLRMPVMDGVEVVKSVKHMRPDIDVIIITGYATVETAVECMKYGAMDYVQKPFTEDELRAFVKQALVKRQDRIERQLKPTIRLTHTTEPDAARAGEFSIPGGVLISRGHCWVSLSPDGSVKVGMDDFAKKLIGRVDALELPKVGATLRVGQPLFAIRQKSRRIEFLAPVSGRVTTINQGLSKMTSKLDTTPYHGQWISIIAGENLDAEIPALKIGKSAEALFQDDIGRFTAFLRETAQPNVPGQVADPALCRGALEALNDDQWNQVAREYFGGAV
jgi:CheY-like chemotaxis protein/glycine cleavage system H lipoate-binding protein